MPVSMKPSVGGRRRGRKSSRTASAAPRTTRRSVGRGWVDGNGPPLLRKGPKAVSEPSGPFELDEELRSVAPLGARNPPRAAGASRVHNFREMARKHQKRHGRYR